MLFQLPSFLVFLLVFTLVFACTPKAWKKTLIVLASLFFYAWWNPLYLPIIFFFIAYTWVACLIKVRQRVSLFLLVGVAVAPLIFYKYLDFFLVNLSILTRLPYQPLGYVLPLGISFISFTVISIVVDTYKTQEKGHSLTDIALLITFFPHLIAGPILRKHQFFPQIGRIHLDWGNSHLYLMLFAVGIIKKVVFADSIGAYVDDFYLGNGGGSIQGLAAVLGFAAQIYCDFSAYTDMAIALAGFLGVRFPENFRSPYFSCSLTEIWQRWHMTLSFWLRDYVFLPLHKVMRKKIRYFALVFTMIISGLWHGASWNFVLWGALNGLVMFFEAFIGVSKAKGKTGIFKVANVLYIFILWSLLAVFFRAPTLTEAHQTFSALVSGQFYYGIEDISVFALVAIMLCFHGVDRVDRVYAFAKKLNKKAVLIFAPAIILACSLSAMSRPENFYYFNF